MDQEAILAKLKETITPFLEEILRNGRVVVVYRTPKEDMGCEYCLYGRFFTTAGSAYGLPCTGRSEADRDAL